MNTPAKTGWAQAAMIHYSQFDARWRDYEYAPGHTMMGDGCLLTAIAMVGSLYYGEGITPLSVAQVLGDVGAFDGGMLMRPGALSIAWPRLTYGGRTDWHWVSANLDDLQQELGGFGATVILVQWKAASIRLIADNTHFVVLTEVSEAGAQIVDPWGGETKSLLSTQYAYPGWTVGRAIYGVRKYRVELSQREKSNAKRDAEHRRIN